MCVCVCVCVCVSQSMKLLLHKPQNINSTLNRIMQIQCWFNCFKMISLVKKIREVLVLFFKTRQMLMKICKYYIYRCITNYLSFCLFKDVNAGAVTEMNKVVLGVYTLQHEGAEATDPPEDIAIIIEGSTVLQDLGDVANGCAVLFGLVYCLNLSYPKDRRY